MRLAVTGGGTGGHVMPAIAVVEAWRRLDADADALYVGGEGSIEASIVPGTAIPFAAVPSRKVRRLVAAGTLIAAATLVRGFAQARTYLRAYAPDVVLGTGGYAATATCLAAQQLRIPTAIHEGNAIPGRTNRLAARRAVRVYTTFEETTHYFPSVSTLATGFPVRESVLAAAQVDRSQASVDAAIKPGNGPLVLVTGGSQGAAAINSAVELSAAAWVSGGARVLHLTGRRNDAGGATPKSVPGEAWYEQREFLVGAAMPAAMRAANLVVCRGGMSTLAELLVLGRAALVVPLPSAYRDHQSANARLVAARGAAAVLDEASLPESLSDTVAALLANDEVRGRMETSAAAAAAPEAAETIARDLASLAGRGR